MREQVVNYGLPIRARGDSRVDPSAVPTAGKRNCSGGSETHTSQPAAHGLPTVADERRPAGEVKISRLSGYGG